MNRDHAFVVVGCGGLGSAVLYWLSRMAAPYATVLGLDRDGPTDPASRDRPVRYAPHAGARAALAAAARDAWRQVECLSGQALVAVADGLLVEGADAPRSARRIDRYRAAGLEEADLAAVAARWPQFRFDGTERVLVTADCGVVDARRADATHVALARGHGAEVRTHTPVRAVHDAGRHVEIVTDEEVYRAEHVVVAAGDGTASVLAGTGAVAVPLRGVEGHRTVYASSNLIDFSPERFPVFTWHGAESCSGLPVHGEIGTTLDRHPDPARSGDPESLRRKRQAEFLAERVPGFAGPELRTRTRRWAVAPDGAPVLGPLPGARRVSVAAGVGPGHTFTSVAGRIVAELAAAGRTRHPAAAFAPDRPSLRRSAKD